MSVLILSIGGAPPLETNSTIYSSQSLHDPTPLPPELEEYEMVGLSVILESYRDFSANKFPRVISKGSIVIKPLSSHSSSPNLGFLHCCFLCKKDLCPNKDIYMYKGDKAFCSVECRCRQMFIDEEEESSTKGKRYCTSSREYNCSLLAAIKAPRLQQGTTSPPSYSRGGRGPRTRHNAF